MNFIIYGISRSGSKLLKNSFNLSEEVYCCGELRWKSLFFQNNLSLFLNGNFEKCKDTFLNEINKIDSLKFLFIKKLSSPASFDFFLTLLNQKINKKHVGAKYPISILNSNKFIKSLPSYKHVFLVRNPKDTLRSDMIYKNKVFFKDFSFNLFLILLSTYHLIQYFIIYINFKKNNNILIFNYDEAIKSNDSFNYEMNRCFKEFNIQFSIPKIKNSSKSFNINKYENFKGNIISNFIVKSSNFFYKKVIQ